MTSSGNYNPAGLSSNTDDVRINRTSASLTITASSLTMESLSVNDGNTFTISNATSTATNSTLTLGNSAGFTNVFSGVANDLFYLTGNSTLTIQGPNSSSGTGVLNLVLASTGNFNIATGSSLTISSVISGSGQSIIKTGGGILTLSGANTHTGGTTNSDSTTVTGGTLLVNNSSGSGTGSGPVFVGGSGTTLGGNGTISGPMGLGPGANLSPGATGVGSTAVLHTGSVTLNSGSFLNVDLNNTTVGTGYDQVSVTGVISISGSNLVVNAGPGLSIGQKFFIVANDGFDPIIGGSFAQGATVTSGLDVFLINYADNFDGGFVPNDISLTVIAVPEPGTWFAAGLAFVVAGYSQRKRLSWLLIRA